MNDHRNQPLLKLFIIAIFCMLFKKDSPVSHCYNIPDSEVISIVTPKKKSGQASQTDSVTCSSSKLVQHKFLVNADIRTENKILDQ